MKLAAQLHTVRHELSEPGQFATTLAKVKEAGYAAVEMAWSTPQQLCRLSQIAQELGLEVLGWHVDFEALANDPVGLADQAATAAAHTLTVRSIPAKYHSAAGYAEAGRRLTEIAELLQPAGVGIGCHVYTSELEYFDGSTGLDLLAKASDPHLVSLQLDTFWLQVGGADPATWIEHWSGRQRGIHVKDVGVLGGQIHTAEVGAGHLNWPRIVAACAKAGVQAVIVEQDEVTRDVFEALVASGDRLVELGVLR